MPILQITSSIRSAASHSTRLVQLIGAQDEALIAGIQAGDRLELAVPMDNFAIPTQFKTWIDAITKAGVMFRYTGQGPAG